MAFQLPPLPYADTALEPHISAKTLSFHHGKHHKAYVDKLNELVKGTDLETKSLEEVIIQSEGKNVPVFNNAAQVWNHTFYWNCMKQAGGGKATGAVAAKIEEDFGSFDKFVEEFKTAGATQFGSGWAWLVVGKDGKLKVTKTGNAEVPFTKGETPILTMDVWEHAYYLDYQNLRPKYIETFLASLINWDFVNKSLAEAQSKKAA